MPYVTLNEVSVELNAVLADLTARIEKLEQCKSCKDEQEVPVTTVPATDAPSEVTATQA